MLLHSGQVTRCPTLALSKILALHFGHILIKRNMMLTSLFGKLGILSEVDTNQGGFCLQNSSHRRIHLPEAGPQGSNQQIVLPVNSSFIAIVLARFALISKLTTRE